MPNPIEKPDLKVGEADSLGDRVVNIFFTKKEKYIIYEIAGHRVRVDGDTSPMDQIPLLHSLFSEIADYTADNPEVRKKYVAQQAHGLFVALEGNPAGAVAIFREIRDRLLKSLRRPAELAYLGGAALVVGFCLLVFLAIGLLRCWGSACCLEDFHIDLLTGVIFAALGGMISVFIGLQELDLDVQYSYKVNALFGGFRIAISLISGLVLFFLLQTKILFGFLPDLEQPSAQYGMSFYFVLAFASGFSEKLIPNVLKTWTDQLDPTAKALPAGSIPLPAAPPIPPQPQQPARFVVPPPPAPRR